MPELPEVETVRRGLAELLPGRVVARATVFDSPKSFPNAPADVEQFLYGARVTAVRRRAKVLMIDLDTRYSLVVHLKMTGQLVFRQSSRHSARVSPKKSRGPRKVALIFSGNTAPGSSICINEKPMTTRQIGDKGEQAAADWLMARGHEIVARNWRTRYCEIDIVSVKGEVLYFTEVKYRKNDDFGDGLAAITAKKQRQMRFAAELFLAGKPECSGMAAKLLAASVNGDPPVVQAVVEVN